MIVLRERAVDHIDAEPAREKQQGSVVRPVPLGTTRHGCRSRDRSGSVSSPPLVHPWNVPKIDARWAGRERDELAALTVGAVPVLAAVFLKQLVPDRRQVWHDLIILPVWI